MCRALKLLDHDVGAKALPCQHACIFTSSLQWLCLSWTLTMGPTRYTVPQQFIACLGHLTHMSTRGALARVPRHR